MRGNSVCELQTPEIKGVIVNRLEVLAINSAPSSVDVTPHNVHLSPPSITLNIHHLDTVKQIVAPSLKKLKCADLNALLGCNVLLLRLTEKVRVVSLTENRTNPDKLKTDFFDVGINITHFCKNRLHSATDSGVRVGGDGGASPLCPYTSCDGLRRSRTLIPSSTGSIR
uniref:Recep_L_domain domain-containing protein n=1 Tax=Panagrellus redivivus TaxID=6233 RepID=A0A7E4UY89_PANRE